MQSLLFTSQVAPLHPHILDRSWESGRLVFTVFLNCELANDIIPDRTTVGATFEAEWKPIIV